MALNYSSKHDISYASYNNKTIPWKVNTSIISQNNQNTNPSLNLGTINNNLVIESSQNDILFITSQNDNDNKKVIVKNNMDVDANLDVSNNLTTKLNVSYDISLNNILYFPSLPVNIIGDLKVRGAISVLGKETPGLVKSKSQFVNVTLSGSRFTDVSIVSSTISVSDFSNVNIINSYINDIPNGFGYDKSNNALPNKAIFSDVSLQSLILDSSINSSYINFANNTSNAISIRSSADYSKLVISKPLNVGTETINNISNVSIFYGDISCNNLYYSRLVPDVKLNNYSDVSIGEVSISGNNVPTSNIGINIGSNAYKFNNTYSTYFNGDLSGQATLANNLIKNLDMSFNNLDICGTITLNKLNLNQFLSKDLTSIVDGNSSFITISNKVRDLSAIVYTKSDFDLCLNTYITKISLLETSFIALNGNITGISNSVYSKSDFDLSLNTYITKISLLETSFVVLNANITSISNSVYSKSDFDLCLNRNILRISDVSAIASVVTTPPNTNIYDRLGYNDNLSIKQTNAKVVNELVFPYAITYIDDVTEDTLMRESLARIAVSQDGSIVVSATAIGVTYEVNSSVQTWEWHRTNAISSGRSLAVILNATQNEQARVVASAANPSSAPFIGALRTSKPNPPNLNNTSEYWQWVTGATWSYTNFNNGEPNGGASEPVIEFIYWYGGGVWNDITSNVSKPAVYMNTYGIGNGSFKISDNTNNKSYYIKSSASVLPSTISSNYSCIAITNDGMFVALGKATNVTIYMKNSSGWQTLGTPINVDFSRYTDTCCNILWDGYDPAMYSNLQNLAINFNYNNGSTSSQLILAFGDSRTSIKVYSYSGGSWSFSNASYSVAGGTWGSTFLRAHNATTAEINNNNFGYFVTLSQSPSILGFTVANKFYTYNCTNSDGSQRGTVQTLGSSHNSYTNIIAFKMSSDAEKIIVSNTYYVFIYKWNITNWTLLTTINLVSANIRTDIQVLRSTIGATVSNITVANPTTIVELTTPWLSEPFSAAINFDGTIIANTRGARNADIIQVWKYSNNNWTELASPSPSAMTYYPELSDDGTICVYSGGQSVGAEWSMIWGTGFVEVRRYNPTTFVWTQIFKRMETNWVSQERCALSKDGKVVAITTTRQQSDYTENNPGVVNVYKYVSDMNWTAMGQTLTGTSTIKQFATGIALSYTGDFMVCSTPLYSSYRGIARIYRFNTPVASQWNLIGEISGPVAGKYFGWQQAAMSSNGQTIAIGSYGYIYVYKYISDMNWTQIGAIRGPNIYDEHFYFPTLSSDGTVVGLGQGGAVATRGDTPFVGNRAIQLWKYVNSTWTLTYDTLSPLHCDVVVASLSGNGRSFFISSRANYPIVYTVTDTSSSYTIHSFKTIGNAVFVPAFTGTVEVLLVGGGGGGGSNSGAARGGGGGGGGVVYMPNVSVNIGERYNIVVGGGGLQNTNGQDTTAFGAIAAGGGTGGSPVGNGGSGGGASAVTQDFRSGGTSSGNTTGPNSGTIYGNSGGNNVGGYYNAGLLDTIARGAGGGGAGSSGTDTGLVSGQLLGSGDGGAGVLNSILGTDYYWGGGGGGASLYGGGGTGGKGGGGGGSVATTSDPRAPGGGNALNPGTPGGNANDRSGLDANFYYIQGEGGQNTGGGGGGAGLRAGSGGPGGSGIVVIRYSQTLPQSQSLMLLTSNIPVAPRSLDISNISSDECVFAIGFPDKLIDTSANRKARGYVEYWKYSNAIATRLATLVPRKRNIDNSNVDTDEYFFSAGGIKITNANTILVAPNFKFHLSSTNKIYTLSQNSLDWATHNNNSNAKAIVGREIASIENEADNELVKVSARNNNVWIGATRSALTWVWSDPSSVWNYTSFNSGQPDNISHTRVEFQSATGTWYDIVETSNRMAVYMTRLQYSLNTFTIFNNFFLHLSGFSSSYANTDIATAVIAKWVRTDSPSTQPIEFRGNGNIMRNSQGSFTTSDIRLKENIVDASPKLVDLLKVRVVNYNLKGSDGTKLIGVVAQELEALFPTLVNNGELSPHDTYLGKTESYKSVKYSCFDVILIKAFQEQMAIINKLSAQLDELERKTKLLKTISQEHAILKQDLEFLKRENELFKLNINEITMLMAKC